MTSYIRFNVQGLVNPVTRATLRLFSNTTTNIGFDVRTVADNTWGETTITYNNAPPTGSVIGTSGAITVTGWISIDVTSVITGNGTVSLGAYTASGTVINLGSRESANPPQLVIETLLASAPTGIDIAYADPSCGTTWAAPNALTQDGDRERQSSYSTARVRGAPAADSSIGAIGSAAVRRQISDMLDPAGGVRIVSIAGSS